MASAIGSSILTVMLLMGLAQPAIMQSQSLLAPQAIVVGWDCTPSAGFAICPEEPLIADFTNDGIPDLLGWWSANTVLWFRHGLPGFTWGADVVTTLTANPCCSWTPSLYRRAMDLNGDGNLDAIISGAQGIQSLLGLGNGQFLQSALVPFSGGNDPTTIDVGDLDLDGNPDLVYPGPVLTGGTVPSSITIATAMQGVFVGQLSVTLLVPISWVRIGDFNGDSLPDILCIGYGAYTGSLFVLTHDIATGFVFTMHGPFPAVGTGLWPAPGLHVADINGDGCDDLLGQTGFTLNITSYRGHPTSVMQPGNVIPLPASPTAYWRRYPTFLDFDVDGFLDIAFESISTNPAQPLTSALSRFGIYRGYGDGTFAQVYDMALSHPIPMTTLTLIRMSLADLDQDGDLDPVVTRDDPGGFSSQAFLNQSIAGPGSAGTEPLAGLRKELPVSRRPGDAGFTIGHAYALRYSAGYDALFDFIVDVTNTADHPFCFVQVQDVELFDGEGKPMDSTSSPFLVGDVGWSGNQQTKTCLAPGEKGFGLMSKELSYSAVAGVTLGVAAYASDASQPAARVTPTSLKVTDDHRLEATARNTSTTGAWVSDVLNNVILLDEGGQPVHWDFMALVDMGQPRITPPGDSVTLTTEPLLYEGPWTKALVVIEFLDQTAP